jgi:hypothetical protein
MSDAPRNAGQTLLVEDIIVSPVKNVDFGSITVTENWGRLFIRKDRNEIVISKAAYAGLIKAIQHFADLPPTLAEALKVTEVAALVEAAGVMVDASHDPGCSPDEWERATLSLGAALAALKGGQ